MRPDQILKFLRARPFHPFRVYVSDGAIYDVAHPEAAWLLGPILITHFQPSGFAEPPGQRLAHDSLMRERQLGQMDYAAPHDRHFRNPCNSVCTTCSA